MPVMISPHHLRHGTNIERTSTQKICISFGIALIVVGFLGVLIPSLMGMHLSVIHNGIHIGSGALAVWSGASNPKRAVRFTIVFGAIYGFLGIVGFVLGEPGYPALGSMEADQNLLRLVPSFFELGTMDHIVHMLISAFLLYTAYFFRSEKISKYK
jgi:hypothetical protein